VTVVDAVKLGTVELLEGRRLATVGETLIIEVDVAVYGAAELDDARLSWHVDDTSVALVETIDVRMSEPHTYHNVLVLRGAQPGVTRVSATHPLRAEPDPWQWPEPEPDPEVAVTFSAEPDTAFVVIRDGDRTVDLGDTFCFEAYVGMPTDEPRREDGGMTWTTMVPDVVELPGLWFWSPEYPFVYSSCGLAVGVGVTKLVATSNAWPDVSAGVTIEVREAAPAP